MAERCCSYSESVISPLDLSEASSWSRASAGECGEAGMAGGTVDLVTVGGLFEARTISQMIRPMATGIARMKSTMIQCQMLKLPMCLSPIFDSIDQATNT